MLLCNTYRSEVFYSRQRGLLLRVRYVCKLNDKAHRKAICARRGGNTYRRQQRICPPALPAHPSRPAWRASTFRAACARRLQAPPAATGTTAGRRLLPRHRRKLRRKRRRARTRRRRRCVRTSRASPHPPSQPRPGRTSSRRSSARRAATPPAGPGIPGPSRTRTLPPSPAPSLSQFRRLLSHAAALAARGCASGGREKAGRWCSTALADRRRRRRPAAACIRCAHE